MGFLQLDGSMRDTDPGSAVKLTEDPHLVGSHLLKLEKMKPNEKVELLICRKYDNKYKESAINF